LTEPVSKIGGRMSWSYSPLADLNLLKEFEDKVGFEKYAEGFGLLLDFGDDTGLRAGWSADPGFLARLTPFAQANGSGSFYALWQPEEGSDLATAPVVVFGDEGGAHVVARDLRELLQLLTLDIEITVEWEEAFFWQEEDGAEDGREHSVGHHRYLIWLHEVLGVAPVTDSSLLAGAQDEIGADFAEWLAEYLGDDLA
jgi:hypothetical protein